MTAILEEAEKLCKEKAIKGNWGQMARKASILQDVLTEARRLEAEVKRLEGMWDQQQALIADMRKGTDNEAISDLMGQVDALKDHAIQLKMDCDQHHKHAEEYKADRDRWKAIAEEKQAIILYCEDEALEDHDYWSQEDDEFKAKYRKRAARELETKHSNHIVGPDQMVVGKYVRPKEGNSSALSSCKWRCVGKDGKMLIVEDVRGITYKIPTEECNPIPNENNPTITLTPERREALEYVISRMGGKGEPGADRHADSVMLDVVRSMLVEDEGK